MTGALLLAWGALVASLGANPPTSRHFPRLDDVADHFRYPGVDVAIQWKTCGHPNAFYDPSIKTVSMCLELIDSGLDDGLIRFFFAHEMAHAVIWQLNVPYTTSEEAAADELASMIMVLSGNGKDVEAAADYFATQYGNGYRVPPWDDHPDHLKRAINLMCYSLGRNAQAVDSTGRRLYNCPRDWNRMVWSWTQLLPHDE